MGSVNPFTLSGLLWVGWLLVGVIFGWLDLKHKVSLGFLSLASFITVFTSFYTALASQLLVFGFSAIFIFVFERVHEEHHRNQKRYYIH